MSKIGKGEWIIVFIVAGIIDLIQLLLQFIPVIGQGLDMYSDPIIGALLIAYFQLRGVSVFHRIGRFASMLGIVGLSELTGGLAAFWVLDIWYIYKSVKNEEMEDRQSEGQSNRREPDKVEPAIQNRRRNPTNEEVNLN